MQSKPLVDVETEVIALLVPYEENIHLLEDFVGEGGLYDDLGLPAETADLLFDRGWRVEGSLEFGKVHFVLS